MVICDLLDLKNNGALKKKEWKSAVVIVAGVSRDPDPQDRQ